MHTDWISLSPNLIHLVNGLANMAMRRDLPITAHLPSRHSTPQESSVTPHHRKAPAIFDPCHSADIMHRFLPLGLLHSPLSLVLLFPLHFCFHPPRVWLKCCFIQDAFVPPSSASRKKCHVLPIPKALPIPKVCISDASGPCVFPQLISPARLSSLLEASP